MNHKKLYSVLKELRTDQKVVLIESLTQLDMEDFIYQIKSWSTEYSDGMSQDEVLEKWVMPFIEDYLCEIVSHTQQYFEDYLYDLSGIAEIKKDIGLDED